MSISRRTALATGAAAIVTGATVAPLALKAAGVEAALAGDPVLPAFEAFEAARLQATAISDYRLAIVEAVEAELPPEPHPNRTYLELSDAEREEGAAWRRVCNRRVTARLGMGEDDFMDIYYARVMLAYKTVADIRPTTVAGLLCQVRAWWSTYEGYCNIQTKCVCFSILNSLPPPGKLLSIYSKSSSIWSCCSIDLVSGPK